MAGTPPAHVAAAAKVVDDWLKGQPPIAAGTPAVKEQSAAEKFRAYRLAQFEPSQKG